MTHPFSNKALVPIFATLSAASSLSLADPVPNPASNDVFIGFRASGGDGASSSYLVKVGTYSQFNSVPTGSSITLNTLGNLGTDLAGTYGATWHSRGDLFWGAFGIGSSSSAIVYSSRERNPVNTASTAWPNLTDITRSSTFSQLNSTLNSIGGYRSSTATANSAYATLQTNFSGAASYNYQVATAGTSDFGSVSQWSSIEGDFGDGASGTALNGPITLGSGFTGDLDEVRFHNTALDAATIKLAFTNQSGSEASLKLLAAGTTEGGESGGHLMEHLMLFGDIANNMMFDGWIAIGICVIMIVVGWTVAIKKFAYLNKIEKGNKLFLEQWKSLSTDLTALDHADASSVKSMGGVVDEEDQDLMKDSPLYHIYHIGAEEISHRIQKMGARQEGLPGRSIQAIRASLDAGLVHENHRLTNGLVYLTISVAGGPYVGLLGTVVGVMITFAIIAKSGEVNVNSIAPGIASALLATVVGLIVAIPALFIYSYLNSRIKNVVASMQVFIDEFVAKMAEFYQPRNGSASGDNYSI